MKKIEYILVTGGCGFIGSHTCVPLLNSNYNIVIIDNLVNSNKTVLNRIHTLTNKNIEFMEGDICDTVFIEKVFSTYTIKSVVHFAALKSVNESIKCPLKYYNNNITGTINILNTMLKYDCYNMVFSSSATVYGEGSIPFFENSNTGIGISNPYGRSKYVTEQILKDLCESNHKMCIVTLRYFNPVGAHISGLIGEDPYGIPNNIFPYILKVASNNNTDIKSDECYKELSVFGGDYDTLDGTCIRDYIHVVDLANGHLKTIDNINNMTGYNVFNLGTGVGTSVLQLLDTFIKVNNVKVPYTITDRRQGDVQTSYCNADKALHQLGWKTELTLEDICRDGWNWQKNSINR
jgi:UDP-glucose 4-epimerase